MYLKIIFVPAFALCFLVIPSQSYKPPVFTNEEKTMIDKLRLSVEGKITANHMKSDAYLYKWLKAKHFDHDKAKEVLEKTLTWRKEIDADNLPGVEFGAEINKNYVMDFTTSKDKNGNPVILIPFGDWDLHKQAIAGQIVTVLGKRLDYLEEKASQLGFNTTGDPTTFLIIDIGGFSLRKHGCVGCIPFYLNWVVHHEVHYPYNFYEQFCINSPKIFEPVVNLMRPLMTASTRDAFKTFDYNREEYSKLMSEHIDLNQLPVRFGGKKRNKT